VFRVSRVEPKTPHILGTAKLPLTQR
jgi:hypothetical protein